ncbi:NAD(P)-dependent oxidoreductase [Paenibacillus solisilvae]|uniref:NAD(P)-dependent oxidoreductase n=1 Tax=Paenibacillus solisilvae TaxID=2486751 RepID=A0ABW0W6A1_9BACL
MNRLLSIGWIGLGSMGVPMVKNLLKAGFQVRVYNRSPARAEEVLKAGAVWAGSPKETVQQSDMTFTMVSDAAAVEALHTGDEGILAAPLAGKIVVDMSTIGPEDSRRFAQLVKEHGGEFLDAPVSGSVKPAQDGQLVILAGGNADVFEICQPMFRALGKRSILFGENGSGCLAKLVINLLLGITVQGVSEALVLADKVGLNRAQVLEMMLESALGSPFLRMKQQLFLENDFPAAFALRLMHKDIGLALDVAGQTETPLPAASAANTVYSEAIASGKGDLDVSAVYLQLKEMAGL